ncbi:MAG: (Fe-S)-binding protein [Planctomycetaceae bacterium]|nr:(Fe-S)-binding protein [Planctomycetaceae bacterium]
MSESSTPISPGEPDTADALSPPLAAAVAESATDQPQPAPAQHEAAAASRAPVAEGAPNPGAGIDYQYFLDCVHCGLCTASCPTYLELGDENDSPRGRIYLMRSVTDGRLPLSDEVRNHLELCLDCRACETACPSGVQYGRLIEPFRVAMEQAGQDAKPTFDWFHRWILFGLFPYPERMRWAVWPGRIAQATGVLPLLDRLGMLRLLPSRLRQLARMLPPRQRENAQLPEVLPAIGRRRARVALFTGCVADAMFRGTHWATVRVLQQNGCDVIVPRDQVCCGAIHYHAGNSDPARDFADQNLAAFARHQVDAVLVNVAGCGAMLKDYGHHWHDGRQNERAEFAGQVRDVHEFLDQLGLIPPTGEIRRRATYHDACHLGHAQKVREAPRKMLAQIPGLDLVELNETEICCGAAGTYNLTQPEMAGRLAQRKLANIRNTEAELVLTANAGCLLQIMRQAREDHARLWIAHPMELLDLSYQGLQPPG